MSWGLRPAQSGQQPLGARWFPSSQHVGRASSHTHCAVPCVADEPSEGKTCACVSRGDKIRTNHAPHASNSD